MILLITIVFCQLLVAIYILFSTYKGHDIGKNEEKIKAFVANMLEDDEQDYHSGNAHGIVMQLGDSLLESDANLRFSKMKRVHSLVGQYRLNSLNSSVVELESAKPVLRSVK
ncbi:hypothetical protein JL49_09125 [Pseudoalteromonas luteoviolacea]|nr:hypothetical protein JL49_09125 [Pseudoalteromonas luteoviolacea]